MNFIIWCLLRGVRLYNSRYSLINTTVAWGHTRLVEREAVSLTTPTGPHTLPRRGRQGTIQFTASAGELLEPTFVFISSSTLPGARAACQGCRWPTQGTAASYLVPPAPCPSV
eukprot:Filipodium_phascolosomae@DN2505_c0_g1_i2.p1